MLTSKMNLASISKKVFIGPPRIDMLTLFVLLVFWGTNVNAQISSHDTLFLSFNLTQTNSHVHTPGNNTEPQKEDGLFLTEILQRTNISGDWWGARNTFNESGIDVELIYKGEMFSNLSGGLKKATTTLDNIDLIFLADLEKGFGLGNTNLKIQFLGNSGGVPCDFVGAGQGISNIETIPTWKLYQALLEKKFFGERLSIATGLYDLNSEFDCRETSSIFINPSHGIGPEIAQSGLNGPSIFPTTSAALRMKYEFGNGNYFQTAILDGVPGDPENPYNTHIIFNKEDGLLLTAEAGYVINKDEQLLTKIAFGMWTYTSKFGKNNFSDNNENSISLEKNYGFYLSAEKLLVSNFENPNKNISGFLRIGYANKNINPVDFYLGGGFKFTGLLGWQEDNALGIAFALAHNSLAFRNSSSILNAIDIKSYELNFEATYLLPLTPWLMLQPDIQYIVNPSYCSQSANAFVVGSRMQLVF